MKTLLPPIASRLLATVTPYLWTAVAILVPTILLLRIQPENVTFLVWLDAVTFPAVAVFLGFWLNEEARKREKARNEEQAENEIRKDFLMSLMRAYNGAKKARRVLKAHRFDGKVPRSVYESQLEALMDAQLELELYKPEKWTKDISPLLPNFRNKEKISNQVDILEKYLNDDGVINEYDGGDYAKVKKRRGLNSPSSQIPLHELKKLEKFIEPLSFNKHFRKPIFCLAKDVQNEIEQAHNR